MTYIAASFLIVLSQLWAIVRGKNAAWRLGLLTALFGLSIGVLALGPTPPSPVSATPDGAYHDTYYVVVHYHYLVSFLLVLGLLTLLLYLGDPPQRPLPKITRWLATLLALSMLEQMVRPIISALWTPRRYVEYESWFQINAWLSTMSSMVFALIYCALFGFAVFGTLRRLNTWSKEKGNRNN